MTGTVEQVRAMREDYYVIARLRGDELVCDFMMYGNPDDLASMMDCMARPGETVVITHESAHPYELHDVLQMRVDGGPGYEVLAESDWLERMKG